MFTTNRKRFLCEVDFNMVKKPTIKDVAQLAGSSITTVSRVLNKSDYPVSEELKKRILEAADQLNYKPNLFGQMLKKGVSKEIGIIVPNLSNPYYAQLVSVLEAEFMEQGYTTYICSSFNDIEIEQMHLEQLAQRLVSGIIISTVREPDEIAKMLEAQKVPVVFFDQDYSQSNYSNVSFNFYKSSCLATEFLIGNGHEEIAFLTPSLRRHSRRQIYQGYQDTLKKYNIREQKDWFIELEEQKKETDDYNMGHLLAKKLLKKNELPQAIIAVNDVTAFGVINLLEESNIKVPDDLSVISFDDIEFAKMFTPSLTTMKQPSIKTGKATAKMLLEQIQSEEKNHQTIMIEPELIIRNTVKLKA